MDANIEATSGLAPDDPLAQLGIKVAKRREDLHFSQPEVLERMNATPFRPGVTRQSHISNIENSAGDKLPSIRALAALAVALETNMDFLAGLTNDPKPPSDLEDQLVIGVRDDEERALLQELFEMVHQRTREEQRFIADVVRRLAAACARQSALVMAGAPMRSAIAPTLSPKLSSGAWIDAAYASTSGAAALDASRASPPLPTVNSTATTTRSNISSMTHSPVS